MFFQACSSTGIPRQNAPAAGWQDIRPLQWIEQDAEKRERQEREQQELERIDREQRERQAREQREREQRERQEQERISQAQRERRRQATDRILNNAEKNFFGLSGFFQWSDRGHPGIIGIEANYSFGFFPFMAFGLDLRLGFFEEYEFESDNGGFYSMYFTLSPNFNLVFPLGNNLRIFTGIALEIGMFTPGMYGIITDWATPSLNFGVLLQSQRGFRILLKYRLISYYYPIGTERTNNWTWTYTGRERTVSHSINVGIGSAW